MAGVMSQLENMQCDKVKAYKAWFSSGLELDEIGEIFKTCGLVSGFNSDYENVYEWFVGITGNSGVVLNVSRKHCDGTGFESEPIHVMVMYAESEPSNAKIEAIAKTLSNALATEVHTGFIEYISGDDYEYRSMSVLSS